MPIRPLGRANIFRDDDGTIIFDQDSLRRFDISGEETGFEFGYEDDDYDDDDDFGYEDDEDDEEEFGASRGRTRRRTRRSKRKNRRADRFDKRSNRLRERADELEESVAPKPRRSRQSWQGAIIAGVSADTDAGTAAITKTLNHTMVAQNINFDGSASTALVTTIIFGDNLILNEPDGIPITMFSSTSTYKELISGAKAQMTSGQTIQITGKIAADNDVFRFALAGKKPSSAGC